MMRHLLFLAAIGLHGLVFADELPAPDAAVVVPAPVEVTVTVNGAVDFAADKGRRLYVEFAASPRLTAAFREALGAAGYAVVGVREEADAVYEIDGAFQAHRPATRRRAEVRVGDYVEHPAPLATKSGRGASVMFGLNPLAILVGTIAANVGNATGAQDAVNAAAAGDPDGKCLTRCETWRYRQRNIINVKRIADGDEAQMGFLSEAVADALVPGVLIEHSMRGVQTALGVDIKLGLLPPGGSAAQ